MVEENKLPELPEFVLTGEKSPTFHDMAAGRMVFTVPVGREVIRLEPNGDIFVHGRLVENDREVVDGMRAFLAGIGAASPAVSHAA